GGVVITGRGGFFVGGWLFKTQAQGFGARAKGGGNPRGQAIAGRAANNQYVFRAIFYGALGAGVVNLLLHMGSAALRVGVNTDKSAYFWLYNHKVSVLFQV